MLKYVSGVNSSFRHWVVRKFAVHGHVCFVCSVFESPWFGGKIGICTVIKAVFDSLASEYYVWNPSTSEGLRLPCKPASDHCGRRCDRNIKLAWGEGGGGVGNKFHVSKPVCNFIHQWTIQMGIAPKGWLLGKLKFKQPTQKQKS